ncbi:phosphonate transport system substrate-binding protein [Oscillibacter sp. PC13]|uniref:PhnD/SsuA/transferrin family substrate-binding protein n=1 Tax=Oscillibacter sp. PC13 TaxID=1855299 RepID=UPI0008EFAB9D|nr:PhnD/SsuA/transferrin family substrate-binding protein [Oscillibacter sp. PC13]SFP59597.1 phosphonate transport system substrate-binding protein [Oscillibacter sp. PC13]
MKTSFRLLAAGLLLAVLTGCGGQTAEKEPEPKVTTKIENLTVEFAPGGNLADKTTLLAPLSEKLQTALKAAGVEVEEVSIVLSTAPAATGQALEEGGVDAAFLPAEALAEFGGSAVPLLSAAWQEPSCDSGNPADWNGEETSWTENWTAGQRVLLLAGPSEYGRNLAARAKSGTELTWEELSKAGWGLSGGRADDMASLWLAERYEGKLLSALPDTVLFESQDELLAALAEEKVDVIPMIADDRIDAVEQWMRSVSIGGWGRSGLIWDETTVIGVTERYYGTTAAVSTESAWSGETLSDALSAALKSLADDTEFSALAGAGPFSDIDGEDLDPQRRLLVFSGKNR